MKKKEYFFGKIIIVTGASSGIGKAIAIESAKNGANVVLAARNTQKLNNISKVIKNFGVECLAVPTDVSKNDQAENLIQQTIKKFGKIDILINNAGISMRAMFLQLKIEVFQKVIDTNFMGAVYCTKHALPHIIAAKGSVVGISSVTGFTPLPARTAYAASKYAMFGFFTTLRLENKEKGLHVLISHPGFTESEIRKHALTANGTEQKKTPRNEEKMMTSENVAKKVLNGIKKHKKIQVMTLQGKLAWILEKICPQFVHKQIYKLAYKEPDTPLPKK